MSTLGYRLVVSVGIAGVCGLAVVSCRSSSRRSPAMASFAGHRLYIQNCAACHGRSGEGNGPAAFTFSRRPRDFRRELFRYVSSTDGVATRKDLAQTISRGRRYGEMPAHPQLSDTEIEILVDYVQKLHLDGWIARLQEQAQEDDRLDADTIQEIAEMRITAEEPIRVFLPPSAFRPDAKRGRELYREACASCHGPAGRGDGMDMPLDNEGRPIKVADLTRGEFAGGRSQVEIYKRILCGVPGTPMPAQSNLNEDDIWQLVYHVRLIAGMPLRYRMLTTLDEE